MIVASVAMLFSFFILIVLIYKKDAQKSTYISFLGLAVFFCLLGNFFEVNSTSIDSALVGMKIRYLGVPFIPTIWYLCVREFCGDKLENKVVLFSLWIIPFSLALLAYTWQDNHLLFSSVTYHNDGHFGELRLIPGPLFRLRLIYQLGINFLGIFTLISRYRSGTKRFKKQAVFFLISAFIPVFNTITYVVPVGEHNVDITAYGLVFALALFAYALYRYGILNLISIIKDNAINNLREGVILFDRDGIYMDSNYSAHHIFPQMKKVPLGTSIDEMDYLPFDISSLHRRKNESKESKDSTEFTLDQGGLVGVFSLSVSQITVKNQLIGYSIIINNISTLKKMMTDLEEKAAIDALTGIYNRRYLYETGQSEVEIASLNHEPLSVIMFDLDHFKKINDTYGHGFGDYVLKSVALLCSNNLRKSDVFARYGGEEFFILLSGTPVGVAYGKAESLRAKISNFAFQVEGIKVSVSASFGVAAYDPADSFDNLIKKADVNLYKAKESGRNRVC